MNHPFSNIKNITRPSSWAKRWKMSKKIKLPNKTKINIGANIGHGRDGVDEKVIRSTTQIYANTMFDGSKFLIRWMIFNIYNEIDAGLKYSLCIMNNTNIGMQNISNKGRPRKPRCSMEPTLLIVDETRFWKENNSCNKLWKYFHEGSYGLRIWKVGCDL